MNLKQTSFCNVINNIPFLKTWILFLLKQTLMPVSIKLDYSKLVLLIKTRWEKLKSDFSDLISFGYTIHSSSLRSVPFYWSSVFNNRHCSSCSLISIAPPIISFPLCFLSTSSSTTIFFDVFLCSLFSILFSSFWLL